MQPALAHILRYKPPAAAGVSLSLDGSVEANGSGATTTVSLTTTKTNNVVIVFVLSNTIGASVSSPALGTFTRRSSSDDGGSNVIECFYAVSSGVLTAEVITVTPASSVFTTVIAFAVNGAKTSAPFDVNGSLPATSHATPSDPLSVTTTAADTMIIGAFRMSTQSNPTAGAGYTAIQLNGDYLLAEYKIVSAAQTGLSVTIGTGASDSNGGVADAIVQGP